MNARDELIAKLRERIYRCKSNKEDARKEYDLGGKLSVLNNQLTDYDNQIAEAQHELDSLLIKTELPIAAPTPEQTWDVFVSYARENEAEAREVNEKLTAVGFSVWTDVDNIRQTARWPLEIDKTLRRTARIVVLLTPAAMRSQEVFNEWFFFYQHRKPIHCLYVETCEVHYQLLPFQYLDWQEPLKRDWTRLGAELRAVFTYPATTITPIVVAPSTPTSTATVPVVSKPGAFADLLEEVRKTTGSIAFTTEQLKSLAEHMPVDSAEYHLTRVAAWSQPRYVLDKRFVQLTLLLDKGEQAEGVRWQSETKRYSDLREVLDERAEDGATYRAMVLLGAPGAGKSTLLRRLQMDSAINSIRANDTKFTFFVALNTYRADSGSPRDWLNREWGRQYPQLPALEKLFQERRVLLLMDALNEMPNSGPSDYHDRVELWQQFLVSLETGNRAVFSCRSLDYSAPLSGPDLRVPQIVAQPMDDTQIQQFLNAYLPTRAETVWGQLRGTPQLGVFRTPFFLKLLCEQIESTNRIPEGKAALFTNYVRGTLRREISQNNRLFRPDTLLTDRDLRKLTNSAWNGPVDLPEDGALLRRIAALAYAMQERGLNSDGAQLRLDFDIACNLLQHDRSKDMITAGVALNVLDEDIRRDEVLFFHQLLQEFFAARKLAITPDPTLVRVAWQVGQVTPSLEKTISGLGDSDPLPPLPQTGWEETTLLAVALNRSPEDMIRALMAVNLPLAARAVASAEVHVDTPLKTEIQNVLIARTQDTTVDLRARIAAGLALGTLGDPRFERRTGPFGDYLLPPLIKIQAGNYPIGTRFTLISDERPRHIVSLDEFQIGKFPVTNAEYALFIESHGYDDEQWWETDAAKAWRKGEGVNEGQKQGWRETRQQLLEMTEKKIDNLVSQNRITSARAEDFKTIRRWSEEIFDTWLDEQFPKVDRYAQPSEWTNEAFNNPAQPVVGVCWYEACAYCAWLSAQTGRLYRLPTETEREAAARGKAGRKHAYGDKFDAQRGNTFESHIRRSTPIGIFPGNVTPEGIADLVGNVWDWTSTVAKPYPYNRSDGREDPGSSAKRALRGGSWSFASGGARAACRYYYRPGYRSDYDGFRVVCGVPPSL